MVMKVVGVSNKHDNDNGRSWFGENRNNTFLFGGSDLRVGQPSATFGTKPTQATRICDSDDFRLSSHSDRMHPRTFSSHDDLSTDSLLSPFESIRFMKRDKQRNNKPLNWTIYLCLWLLKCGDVAGFYSSFATNWFKVEPAHHKKKPPASSPLSEFPGLKSAISDENKESPDPSWKHCVGRRLSGPCGAWTWIYVLTLQMTT